MITHSDEDHIEMFKRLLNCFSLLDMSNFTFLLGGNRVNYKSNISKAVLDAIQERKFKLYFAEDVDLYTNTSELTSEMEILSAETFTKKNDNNNNSIVIKISSGFMSALLCGDAEGPIESKMIQKHSEDTNVLKNLSIHYLGHHGSTTNKTNSTEFLALTNPLCYVISGAMKYDQPSLDLYNTICKLGGRLLKNQKIRLSCWNKDDDRLAELDIEEAIFHTFDLGKITFKVKSKKIFVKFAEESLFELEK